MSTEEIKKIAKYIDDARGRHKEVILPVRLFEELVSLKMSIEILEQEDVRNSIKRAKKNIRDGKTRTFHDADKAISWLNE